MTTRPCDHCGAPFHSRHSRQRYCCQSCASLATAPDQSAARNRTLTPRQRQVLRLIWEHYARGLPPTLRELARILGSCHMESASCHLRPLRVKGCLRGSVYQRARDLRPRGPVLVTAAGLVVPLTEHEADLLLTRLDCAGAAHKGRALELQRQQQVRRKSVLIPASADDPKGVTAS
jgi:hypothetical protein